MSTTEAPTDLSPVDPARQAAIAKKRRRDVSISAASTVVFFVVVITALVTSPGWSSVQQAFFSWPDAKRAFPSLLDGFKLTIWLFMTAEPVILAVATLLAVLRGLRAPVFTPLRIVATAYTDIVRGIPTILLVILFAFGIPGLQLSGVSNSAMFWGWMALVVSYSAYVAEVLRAGIDSVHPSQRAAARSLGLNHAKSLRYVVLPQAVRHVIPPLLNDFISLQKDTALLSIVGVIELTQAAQIDVGLNYNYTGLVVAAGFYILLTVPLARFTDRYASRQAARQQGLGAEL
jgi:polar amino acid transport system permease protein